MAMKSFNLQIYYDYRWMFWLEKTNTAPILLTL